MSCTYTFTEQGKVITLEGKAALKAYLATGNNIELLLPSRAERVPGFRRAPVSNAVDNAFSNDRIEMANRVSSGIASRWTNGPKINVFYGMRDTAVPEEVRAADAAQKEGGAVGEPEGFIYKGEVYLNAEEIPTAQDVARVLFHEALGHYGLRGVYGNALGDVLDQIIAMRKPDVLAKVKEYGLDASDPRQLQVAAEELLAELAQSKPDNGFVKRAIAAIRSWLRQHVPGFASLQLSDAEIVRDFLMPARAFVERGGAKPGNGSAAFSRSNQTETPEFKKWFGDSKVVDAEGKPLIVYHGTKADFNIFEVGRTTKNFSFGEYETKRTGIFFTPDKSFASEFSDGKGRVIQAYLSITNPLILTDGYPNSFYLKHRDMLSENNISYMQPEEMWEMLDEGFPGSDEFIAAVKEDGYDGLKMVERDSDGRSKDVYVALKPEQIKSATDNNGKFDPANPDIRFSRAAPKEEQTGLVMPDQGLLRRVQANMQDNMNRVRQIQDRIAEITGKPVPQFQDYYGAETRRPGRIAARKEDGQNILFKPLIEDLAKAGYKVEDLTQLLHAMHAEERNMSKGKLHPESSNFYKAMEDHSIVGASGMSTNKAKEIITKYKGENALHKLASKARDIAKKTLEMKLSYGLIDDETYKGLTSSWEFYMPLKGDGEYGPRIKTAIGHEEREEYILENIMRDYEQTLVAGEKNLARQSLLAMVLQNPDPELWTVGVPPKGRYVAGKVYEVRKVGSKKAEASFISEAQVNAYLEGKGSQAAQYEVIDSGGERVQSFVRPLQDNEVMVYVDGRPVRIQVIGDEQLARQLRPLDRGQMNVILEGMRSINRYLSRIYTGYNPSFILRNAVRDAITGTVNILGNEGATTAAKAWARYPTAVKAMGQWASTGKVPDNELGKMLTEYRNQGGKTGASYMADLEEQGKTIARLYEDAYGAGGYLADGKYGKAAKVAGRKIVGGMAHVVEVANQATENGLRFALYMAMRDQGVSAGDAAKAAKSVTVDFDRKGVMTGALGAIYLFFNPAVQGTANAIKTLVKGQKREQAWMALGGLAALGVYAALSGMDDDKDRWLGTSWDTRSSNLILKIGDKIRLNVPMSMEFKPFYAFGVAMGEALRGESKLASAGRVMASFFDAYFPLQGAYIEDSDNHGLDLVGAAMPTVIKPEFQAAVNRNSFGSQIAPDNQFVKDQPDNLKMFRSTKNTAYDTAAQKLASVGEAFGAGKYENDITKVSPETLKHFWRTYTGGLGAFVADSIGLGRMAIEDPKQLEIGDVPFAKDFIKQDDVKAIRGRFYDVVNDAKKISNEFAHAKKAADDDAMGDILNRPEKAELLGYDRMIRSTQSAVAKLRDEAVDVNADANMSASEKRAKLKELEAQEEELYRSVIGAFK